MKADYDIEQYFFRLNLNEESRRYLKFHLKCYVYFLTTIEVIRSLLSKRNIKIIDIDPSFFTEIIEKRFSEDSILTLGFEHSENREPHFPLGIKYNKSSFSPLDLNDAQYPDK